LPICEGNNGRAEQRRVCDDDAGAQGLVSEAGGRIWSRRHAGVIGRPADGYRQAFANISTGLPGLEEVKSAATFNEES
jgi:hypothetical protein